MMHKTLRWHALWAVAFLGMLVALPVPAGLSEGLAAAQRGDFVTALNEFLPLAEKGDARAQFSLGVMYANGGGVPKDDLQAVTWYRKAAEQGDAFVQNKLGYMYYIGRGVPKDEQQATAWYRKGAEQGNADAQARLGSMYMLGRGVPKDEQQAYFWWLLASAQGNQDAVKNRDFAERQLSREQVVSAQAAARNWKPVVSGSGQAAEQPFARDAPPPRASAPVRASPDSIGSGFAIARDRLVTNAHVVEG